MELYFESSRIQRQSEIIRHTLKYIKNTNMPLPSLVEISDSGTCNRVCSFCPRSDPNYKNIKKFISEDLHQSICRQLSEYEYILSKMAIRLFTPFLKGPGLKLNF